MAEESGGGAPALSERGKPGRLFSMPKWVLACSAVILLLSFVGSNLWLMSPWGTNTAEKKLQERLGLECEIGSMTWSPWNGITLKRLRVFMPSEDEQVIVDVESVAVLPYWKPLLRRQLNLREISVNQPRVELAVEMLTALPADSDLIEKPPPIPPALAANQVQLIPEAQVAAQAQTTAQAEVKAKVSLADYAEVLQRPSLASRLLAQQKPPQKVPAKPLEKRPPAGAPMRVLVKDGSIRLFSMSKDMDLLNVNQVSIDLPLSGEDADGFIELAGMKVPNVAYLPDFKQKVVWKRPRLEIEEQEVDLGFAKLHTRIQLGVKSTQSRLPFLVDVVIRPQQVESVAWLEQRSMHASAGMIAGRFRLLGFLADPLGWKAEGVLVGESVTAKAGEGRPRVTFDTIYVPAILQKGKLYWPGFKMLGEDCSILGNGRLSMRGNIICVTRLVAAPEVAEVMEKSLSRAGMVETRWWYDMYTPDRKVRDLVVSGNITNPLIDVGPRHTRLPLSHLLNLILHPGKNKILPEASVVVPQSEVP